MAAASEASKASAPGVFQAVGNDQNLSLLGDQQPLAHGVAQGVGCQIASPHEMRQSHLPAHILASQQVSFSQLPSQCRTTMKFPSTRMCCCLQTTEKVLRLRASVACMTVSAATVRIKSTVCGSPTPPPVIKQHNAAHGCFEDAAHGSAESVQVRLYWR